MRRFTRLILDLDSTTSTDDKVRLLAAYFREAPPDDAAWALALLTGNRPRGATSTRTLRTLAQEQTGYPAWLIDECHAAAGDLSETVALLLPRIARASDETLRETMENRVLPLVGAGDDARRRIILDAWHALDADQRYVFHKLIRGGFRIGVQKRLVARALSEVAGVEQAIMLHRLSGAFQPTATAFQRIISPEGEGDESARPYPFFLAHQLAGPPHALGAREDWIAEWKHDGIRAQLIRRAEPALWSRGEELITPQFPEIAAAAASLPEGCVLDGEIVIVRRQRVLPFAALQRRLNRREAPTAQRSLFDEDHAAFIAFDLLELDGADQRQRNLAERRAALERLIAPAPDGVIRLSPTLDEPSWEALAAAREQSRDRAMEGLMLKRRNSIYGVGRAKADGDAGWWKWKIDPYSIDAVLIYAQAGSGRRASLFTDYTFAVWEERNGARALTPFAKAYSGLTNEEIERIDAWIRAHTVSRSGAFREVEPALVFEIAFEGIAHSDRHRSGVAVRFPRILRWRIDKKPDDADSLDTLRALIPQDAHP